MIAMFQKLVTTDCKGRVINFMCQTDANAGCRKSKEALPQPRRPKVTIYSPKGPFCQTMPPPTEPMRIAGREFVFSELVTGSQPSKLSEALAWNNILPPSKHDQSQEILIVGSEIIRLARESIVKAREEMEENSAISADGSWEHPRHSQRCMTTIFDQRTGKVIDYRIKSSRFKDGEEYFCPVPQKMETDSISEMVEELKRDSRITCFIHDKDARISKVLENSRWNITELIDEGHAMKSFDTKLKKYRFPDWVKIKMRRWMVHCVKLTGTEEEKVAWWNNKRVSGFWHQYILEHLIGNHEKCPYKHRKESPKQYEDLKFNGPLRDEFLEFLGSVTWILRRCVSYYSTQVNESFNRTKLKFCTKDVKWGSTFHVRMCCAILSRNLPNWKMVVHQNLKLSKLSPECQRWLNSLEEERIKAVERVHDPVNMQRRNIERRRKREETSLCQTMSHLLKTGHKQSKAGGENGSRDLMRMFSNRFLEKFVPLPSKKLEQRLDNVRNKLQQFVSESIKKKFDKKIQKANLNLANEGKDVIRKGGDFEKWSNEARCKRRDYIEAFISEAQNLGVA
jgi:hypothetical protein